MPASENLPRIVAIVGPTASGKSSLVFRLAREVRGEIISADSMQVYRGMDIGTAKPTAEEQAGIRHHLISIVNPDEEFSGSDLHIHEAGSRVGE